MRSLLTKPVVALLCLLSVVPAFAVTQKEMEQARTITAFWYLRFANNGAGYMEQAKMPSTMAELEKILKETEKKNLKAFQAVKTPAEYADWDKAKLVAYWGDTFFSSPGLSAQGKVARQRVKSKLNAMTIAAPAPAEAAKPAEQLPAPKEEAAASAEAAPSAASEKPAEATEAGQLPSATEIVAQAEALDSAALAVEDNAEAASSRRKSSGGSTWIYIVALVILVGVVVWLVIFASKTMQEGNARKREDEEPEREPEVLHVAPRRRIEPRPEPSEVPVAVAHSAADVRPKADESAELRARDREIKGLREECVRLGEENTRLQADLSQAHREIEALRARLNAAATAATAAVGSQPAVATAAPRAAAPVRHSKNVEGAPRGGEQEVREIYLGRVNNQGLFVRADKRPVAEKSVFVLNTTDGYTGTYRVLQIAEVIERCLDNPDHYLAGGCSAPDILATEDAVQIRTLQAGTAIFENGCWRMIRKTKIVYE